MKYYSDGFTIGGNPATEGGYTVVDETGKLIHQEVIWKDRVTNNDVEILGILHALEIARFGDVVSTDSMTALTWVNTGKSKLRKDLNEILRRAKSLKEEKHINLCWEGREFNLAGIRNEEQFGKYEFRQRTLI